jgi:hypothetical protein
MGEVSVIGHTAIICVSVVLCLVSILFYRMKRSDYRDRIAEEIRNGLVAEQDAFKARIIEECSETILAELNPEHAQHASILKIRREVAGNLRSAKNAHGHHLWTFDEIESHVKSLYPLPGEIFSIEPEELQAQIKRAIVEVFTRASQ